MPSEALGIRLLDDQIIDMCKNGGKTGHCKEPVPASFPIQELTANTVHALAVSWVQLPGTFIIFCKVSGLLQEVV